MGTNAKQTTSEIQAMMAADPAEFRARLLIDCDGVPRRLDDVLDDWQRRDFEALDGGWNLVVGHRPKGTEEVFSRAYLERGRGSSKTSDLAISVIWPLVFSPRRLRGVGAAGSKDQAKLLVNALSGLVALNPWLGLAVDVSKYHIANPRTGSEISVISADVNRSFGLLADFIVCDELVHWGRRGLWVSLISAAAKRANCMLCVISNSGAGKGHAWQWRVRELCRTDPNWYFSRLDGLQASWISAKRLAEQERQLLPIEYRQYWLNEWVAEHGDAFDQQLIEDAVVCDGPMEGNEEGWRFVAGLDVGITNDHTAFCIVGRHLKTGRRRLAWLETWKPPRGGEVCIETVTNAIIEAFWRFRFEGCVYDRTEATAIKQEAEKHGIQMRKIDVQPTAQNWLATLTLSQFQNRNVEMYRDSRIIRGLGGMMLVHKGGKYRFEAPRDRSIGHADAAVAFLYALAGTETVKSVEPQEIVTPWDQSEFARY